jgi:hypothetical protein
MAVRYVVLSDLHLGAKESLLTHLDHRGKVARDPSDVMDHLGQALRATVAPMAGGEPVQLVLLGDALDLGLTPFGTVSRAFLHLVDALWPEGEAQVFSDDILCIPGNHDHHLWRMAQDRAFVDAIADAGEAEIPSDIPHVSRVTGNPAYRCALMEAILTKRAHMKGAQVRIAYPNYAIASEDASRAVVFHHGHYIDAMYRTLSRLRAWIAGTDPRGETIAQIEAENGAWVDFLWSNLGSAGDWGSESDTLYETMLDAGASHDFAEALALRVCGDLGAKMGVRGDTEIKYGVTVEQAIRGIVDLTAGRAAQSQRDGYAHVLSGGEVDDLGWYMSGPVARQLKDELGCVPDNCSLIFGHTHKPFQDQVKAEGFAKPLGVYNTGGWVLDQPTLMATQGGAAMFVDDQLGVASLRLFNDPVGGRMRGVHAAGCGRRTREDAALVTALQSQVEANRTGWDAFTSATKNRILRGSAETVERFQDHEHCILREAAR